MNSEYTGPRPPFRVEWEVPGIAYPIIVGDTAYASTHKGGELVAVSLADGSIRWRQTITSSGTGIPDAADGDLVYVGSQEGMAACEIGTGEIRWRGSWFGPTLLVTVGEEEILCIETNEQVVAADGATGRVRWRRRSIFGGLEWLASLLHWRGHLLGAHVTDWCVVSGVRLAVAGNTGAIVCISARSGATLWRCDVKDAMARAQGRDAEDHVSYLSARGGQVFGLAHHTVLAVDAASGGVTWVRDVAWVRDVSSGLQPQASFIQGLLLVVCGGELSALDAATGLVRWSRRLCHGPNSGTVYASVGAGIVLATVHSPQPRGPDRLIGLNAQGEVLWDSVVPGLTPALFPTIVGDSLIALRWDRCLIGMVPE